MVQKQAGKMLKISSKKKIQKKMKKSIFFVDSSHGFAL